MHEDYNALPGITASAIKAGRISMAHMRHEMLRPRDDSDATPSKRWGTLMHANLLEPGSLIVCDDSPSSNAYKAKKAQAAMEGKRVITASQSERLRAAREAFFADRYARQVWESFDRFEAPHTWTDPMYGAAKCRTDMRGHDVFGEYKSTAVIARPPREIDDANILGKADSSGLMRTFEGMGYPWGLAWYWHGLGRPDTVWCIAQESAAPWTVGCFRVPAAVLEPVYEGKDVPRNCRSLAIAYRACEAANSFPGPYDGPQTYARPEWAGGEWTVDEEGSEG